MKKSAVSLSLAAVALIAASATPALAKGHTQSSAALPSKITFAPSSHAASRFIAPTQALVPAAAARPNPPRFNGLATLFGLLPPRIQQTIATALGNAGPGGDRLCRLLGLPQCQGTDSNG